MKNRGPDQIPLSEVVIQWPFEAPSGKHLLYLIDVQVRLNCLRYSPHHSLRILFRINGENMSFPGCSEPHYESEASCTVLILKISFHSHANKTNFHMKSFALSLAFVMRLKATRKWPIWW